MIKASVIVATYQRDRELEAALASLAGQTFSDFEIVLVDDNGKLLKQLEEAILC